MTGVAIRVPRRLGAYLLGSSLLLCIVAPIFAAEDSFRSYLAAASVDSAQGRFASAKAEIEAAIQLAPEQAEGWYQLGLLYGQMNSYRDAEQSFRHAIQLDPQSARAHCRLGQALVANPESGQDWGSAVAEFRAAVKLDADYPEAESLLGLGLMHLGQTDAAAATLRKVILRHPDEAAAHLDLALVLESQPDGLEEAVREYRASLAAKPDAPETDASLGALLTRLGRTAEAEQSFRTALRLNPDLANAHYGLARVLKAEKKNDDAAVELAQAAALDQRAADARRAVQLSNEGLQRASQADLPGAISSLRQALLLKPDYGIARYNLGLVLADAGDLKAARQSLIEAASLLPARAGTWFDLGRVLSLLGDSANALQCFAWAVRLAPGNAKFAGELSSRQSADPARTHEDALPSSGAGDGPLAAVRQPAFGAEADTTASRVAFANTLHAHGECDAAAGELLRALLLQPASWDARTALAENYVCLLRWDRAVSEYRKVLLLEERNTTAVHLGLGKALLASGHACEAADQFRTVLQQKPGSADARVALRNATRASPCH